VKGVLFNVVEDVVVETLPADTWDDALDAACVGGAYTSLGDYPDAELGGIVAAVSDRTGLSDADVLRHVGRHGYRHLVERQPDIVSDMADLGDLLHRLDAVIHAEVLKLYPDARVPSFRVLDEPGRWEVEYRSERGLCHLAEGLIEGAAGTFGVTATVDQTACTLEGADHCILSVTVV
jgi:predicted hydrocarbon binding protein